MCRVSVREIFRPRTGGGGHADFNDGEIPQRTGTAQVCAIILDNNDNFSKFSKFMYKVNNGK